MLVRGRDHLDAHRRRGAPDLDAVADSDLGDVSESCGTQQTTGSARSEERCVRTDPPQRREVQVVEVSVREQHGVDVGGIGRRQGATSTEMGDPSGEERIGEDSPAAHLDEHRSVTQPADIHVSAPPMRG
jgi:hypothetical protein